MEKPPVPVNAAIDVGSNTIHIVVARCFPTTLEILADELELVRIGASVTADGTISAAKLQVAIQTLRRYRALAEQYGARHILVVATEAIRQASNSAEFIARVKAETGLDMLLISGTAEATLTFLGATYEAGSQASIAVMDLGGGSLELVLASHGRITWRTSLPIGSGWLHDHYLSANPPISAEIAAAEIFLKSYFRQQHLAALTSPLVVTGGSANSLLYLAEKAFHRPHEQHRLSVEDLARCQALLSALQAEDIAHLYDQPLARAQVLLAGTLIIRHIMRRLQVPEITVSWHGIREGVLLAFTRYGEHWLAKADRPAQPEQPPETFVQSARRMLLARLQTMLDWTEEVNKHEDIEAVHKMRVASRRLRAALDAYQSCCDPKLFARVYRQVKQAANVLGEARDTDVMLHYLTEQLQESSHEEEQAGIGWLIARLQELREHQQASLDASLHRLNAKNLERLLKACVRERSDE